MSAPSVASFPLRANTNRLPPPRPTFASELRGTQHMHNGQFILANGSAPSSPGPIPNISGINRVHGGSMAGRMGEGGNEGRRIIKYEEVEGENLIDLY